jgi:dUTP pyrophosphatase
MEISEYLKKLSIGMLPDGEFVHFIHKIIEDHDNRFFETSTIDVIYTTDEYGKAAKELGLIHHSYDRDAGIDLPTILTGEYRVHGVTVYPGERQMLHTGICVAFPKGYWGRIIHRSSTEKKYRLRVIEGVIDDYRGELLVQVHNMNSFPIKIEHGQRIGQLIVLKTASFKCREVNALPPSERGANGFGSSGR